MPRMRSQIRADDVAGDIRRSLDGMRRELRAGCPLASAAIFASSCTGSGYPA